MDEFAEKLPLLNGPSRPRSNKKWIMAVIFLVVGIVLAATLPGMILESKATDKDKSDDEMEEEIFIGAYLKYNVTMSIIGLQSVGSWTMVVTEITNNNYTVTYTPSGISGMSPYSKIYTLEDDEKQSDLGEFIKTMKLTTVLGTIDVDLYRDINGTNTADTYCIKNTDIPVRIEYHDPDRYSTMLMELSSTNIRSLNELGPAYPKWL